MKERITSRVPDRPKIATQHRSNSPIDPRSIEKARSTCPIDLNIDQSQPKIVRKSSLRRILVDSASCREPFDLVKYEVCSTSACWPSESIEIDPDRPRSTQIDPRATLIDLQITQDRPRSTQIAPRSTPDRPQIDPTSTKIDPSRPRSS